jgi:hypothetical protein
VRARRLASQGYHIWTQRIPQDITPKNRLLIGAPADAPASRRDGALQRRFPSGESRD